MVVIWEQRPEPSSVWVLFLKQGLVMQPRLVLKSTFLSARVEVMHHRFFFLVKPGRVF